MKKQNKKTMDWFWYGICAIIAIALDFGFEPYTSAGDFLGYFFGLFCVLFFVYLSIKWLKKTLFKQKTKKAPFHTP